MKKYYYLLGFWVIMTWLITAIHHVYTASIYNSLWRAQFGYSALIPTLICLIALLLHYHYHFRMLKVMISMQVTAFFFFVIGIWEGAWCHLTKLICYSMRIPFHNAPTSWNIPVAPIPSDFFSEATGVLNFVFAALAFYHFLRWYVVTKESSEFSAVSRKFKRTLKKIYGNQIGLEIWHHFSINYHNLYSEHSNNSNKALMKHQNFVILPGIALYDAFDENDITGDFPLTAMDKFYEKYYIGTKRVYQCFGKLPFFFCLLKSITKKQMSTTYPSAGFNTTWIQESKEKIEFHIDHCFYKNTLDCYNRGELTAAYCAVDDYLYKDMSEKIRWERTKTLGRGDQNCDFCFSKR